MSGELLVIAIVAILAFGPGKLPMLARHLGKLFQQIQHVKQQISRFWQDQLNEQQLLDNQKKAEEAEARHETSEPRP